MPAGEGANTLSPAHVHQRRNRMTTQNQDQKKVWELIKDIRVTQIVTHAENGKLAARPMSAVNKEFDGALWFFTKADSPKIAEIEQNKNVLLAYSEPSKQEYISIQGTAEILNDRAKIAELWSEFNRAWFPEGKDDPTIRLIRVEVTSAEYWDAAANALVMLYAYTVALLTGETPKVGENRKVAY